MAHYLVDEDKLANAIAQTAEHHRAAAPVDAYFKIRRALVETALRIVDAVNADRASTDPQLDAAQFLAACCVK